MLGTYVEVSLRAALSDFELISLSNRMFQRISDIQTQMSFHDSQSKLSQINSQPVNIAINLSKDYIELFSIISDLNAVSQGYFDPSIAPCLVQANILPSTVYNNIQMHEVSVDEFGCWQDLTLEKNQLIKHKPVMVDLGGIAKGYAVDKAVELVPDDVEACVNAGGDLRCTDWQNQTVGVMHAPAGGESHDVVTPSPVNMFAPAIATTGAYYLDGVSNIVNPKDGTLHNDLRTYSVFAPSCVLADGLTKLACLMCDTNNDKLNDLLANYGATLIVMD